jgi:hypothetical protein
VYGNAYRERVVEVVDTWSVNSDVKAAVAPIVFGFAASQVVGLGINGVAVAVLRACPNPEQQWRHRNSGLELAW